MPTDAERSGSNRCGDARSFRADLASDSDLVDADTRIATVARWRRSGASRLTRRLGIIRGVRSVSSSGSPTHTVTPGLAEVLPPATQPILTTSQLAGPRLKPSQIVTIYPPDEWEEFVHEWAYCLKSKYVDVRRLSGPGDHGLDVVGLMSSDGLLGEWDGYQCKHYDHSLHPSDAYPEIAKLILGYADETFVLPKAYHFVAPKGVGPKLGLQFLNSSQLKSEFVSALDSLKALEFLSASQKGTIREKLDEVDFAIFGEEPIETVMELHRTSVYHISRFGGQLEGVPSADEPPNDVAPEEAVYVEKLLSAYREKQNNPTFSLEDVAAKPWYRRHLSRQRRDFYSAEALRSFARDKVPPSTFEALQDDIYDAVVETEQGDHDSGIARLQAVLGAAASVQLSQNALISVSRPRDKHGICHQLANDDRLNWVIGGDE